MRYRKSSIVAVTVCACVVFVLTPAGLADVTITPLASVDSIATAHTAAGNPVLFSLVTNTGPAASGLQAAVSALPHAQAQASISALGPGLPFNLTASADAFGYPGGDSNLDHVLDTDDINVLMLWIVGQVPMPAADSIKFWLSDVNEDNAIDMDDFDMYVDRLLNIIDVLPNDGSTRSSVRASWRFKVGGESATYAWTVTSPGKESAVDLFDETAGAPAPANAGLLLAGHTYGLTVSGEAWGGYSPSFEFEFNTNAAVVPIPSAIVLGGIGLGVLGCVTRRFGRSSTAAGNGVRL